MRHDDHHAEKQRERVEIDRPVGFFGRDRADREHQRRVGQRDAGPVQPRTLSSDGKVGVVCRRSAAAPWWYRCRRIQRKP